MLRSCKIIPFSQIKVPNLAAFISPFIQARLILFAFNSILPPTNVIPSIDRGNGKNFLWICTSVKLSNMRCHCCRNDGKSLASVSSPSSFVSTLCADISSPLRVYMVLWSNVARFCFGSGSRVFVDEVSSELVDRRFWSNYNDRFKIDAYSKVTKSCLLWSTVCIKGIKMKRYKIIN